MNTHDTPHGIVISQALDAMEAALSEVEQEHVKAKLIRAMHELNVMETNYTGHGTRAPYAYDTYLQDIRHGARMVEDMADLCPDIGYWIARTAARRVANAILSDMFTRGLKGTPEYEKIRQVCALVAPD